MVIHNMQTKKKKQESLFLDSCFRYLVVPSMRKIILLGFTTFFIFLALAYFAFVMVLRLWLRCKYDFFRIKTLHNKSIDNILVDRFFHGRCATEDE